MTCCLLITFANSLHPDQDRQNISPDLDPNCLVAKNLVLKTVSIRQQKHEKLPSMKKLTLLHAEWTISFWVNYMGESSKFPKSWTLEIQILKLAGCLQKWIISSLNNYVFTNQRSYYNLPNSAFWGWLSMESQTQNPEFRINPENMEIGLYILFILAYPNWIIRLPKLW